MGAYSLSNASSGVVTSFKDAFARISGELGRDWAALNISGNLTGHFAIGAGTDGPQAAILTAVGGGGKSDTLYWPVQIVNSAVRAPHSHYSRMDIVSELGASSFCGPAVALEPSSITNYAVIVRNAQWRLSRFTGFANTDLIAAAALVIPCVLEIQIVYNSALQNTIKVLRNPTLGKPHGDAGDVVIGSYVDNSGAIQNTGLPGFYAGCPNAGDNTNWRNYAGGKL